MNLVGKIFVVLIMVASTVFMTMGLMVFATHQNWHDAVTGKGGWKEQLTEARKESADLRADVLKYQGVLATEKASHLQALAKAQTAIAKAEEHKAELETAVAGEQKRLDAQANLLGDQQKSLSDLRKENVALREDIRDANKKVDQQLKLATETEDKLHIAMGQKRDLEERNKQLASDVAKATVILKKFGATIADPANGEPPPLRGRILAMDKDDRVEISLGSDDGLREGNTLEVYRGSKYLGRIQVLEAHPHQAICMILKEFKQEAIHADDEVATKLKA
ncbi:MAG TPA: hypothetical protein VGY55_24245 [Pirellulales bacterium]|jgi:hypothetical protein|nr:hypothetical protein [Pirellulales bacterium]